MTAKDLLRSAALVACRNRALGIGGLILLTVLVATTVSPQFLALTNIRDILVQAAPVMIIACGVMMVVLTAEIDISVGSMMGVLAAVMGVLTSPSHFGWPVPVAALTVIAIGASIGFVNGVLVAYGRVPSIIVTLGMLTALKGVTEIVLGGEWVLYSTGWSVSLSDSTSSRLQHCGHYTPRRHPR